MLYKSKLHEWMRKASPMEQQKIAEQAGVKLHYLKRLSRLQVPNPSVFIVRRILTAIADHSIMQSDDRLPEVVLSDIVEK